MRVAGRRLAQRLAEHQLARRVGQMLLGADDVTDVHRRVVHRAGEVVGRQPVRAQQHEVTHHALGERDLAAHQVLQHPVAPRDREAQTVRLARAQPRLALVARQVTAAAVVVRRAPRRQRRVAPPLEIRVVAEARVGRAPREQRLRLRAVEPEPLALPVGSARTALARALVEVQAQPCQVVEHALLARRARALDVGVLDAQHHGAAVAAREEPVEVRRARATHVQPARGARSEADARAPAGRAHPRLRRRDPAHGPALTRSPPSRSPAPPRPRRARARPGSRWSWP